jgi:hypothetical protein
MEQELPAIFIPRAHFLQLKLGLYNLFKLKCTCLQINQSNVDIYKNQSQQQFMDLLNTVNYLKVDDIDFEPCFINILEGLGSVYKGNKSNLINYYINIEQGYTSYIDQMKSKHKKELRREVRRFYEVFTDVDIVYYKTDEDVLNFMNASQEIHKNSWKKGILESTDKKSVDKLVMENEWLGVVLFADNKPISYMHGALKTGGKYYLIDNAYCEADKKLKPGKVIISKIIENHGSHNISKIDFGSGMSTYKKIFCNDSHKIYSALISKKLTKASFMFQCQKTLDLTYSGIKKLTTKLNIEHKIRKLVR